MSSSQRWNLKKIFIASRGCGCRQKATDIIEPQPKSQTTTTSDHKTTTCAVSSSAGSWRPIIDDDGYTSTTLSQNIDSSPPQLFPENNQDHHAQCSKPTTTPCRKIHESLAVVKDSDDPYLDFRQSMLQMIIEKEIYSSDDLQQLLQCFLRLNSPLHHEVIVRAFLEICNGDVAAVDCGGEETPPCSTSKST